MQIKIIQERLLYLPFINKLRKTKPKNLHKLIVLSSAPLLFALLMQINPRVYPKTAFTAHKLIKQKQEEENRPPQVAKLDNRSYKKIKLYNKKYCSLAWTTLA